MENKSPSPQGQQDLTGSAATAHDHEPNAGNKDGAESLVPGQGSELSTNPGHTEPDVMEMRYYPDLDVIETRSSSRPPKGFPAFVWRFWTRHVSVSVPHVASRDHLGEFSQKTTGQAYSASANFVPNLAQKILQYLDPQPTDRVLDVGCGDGVFTAKFSSSVAEVLGIDASPSMIESASHTYGSPNATFKVVDCKYLDREPNIVNGQWDKVISNAALHWILRTPTTRLPTLRAIHSALKSHTGHFIFEMGGHGNVGAAHAALISALLHHSNLSAAEARASSPWFFPSESWMRRTLEDVGFEVLGLESEWRPTRLTDRGGGEGKGDGTTGLEGWVRLMGAEMLARIGEEGKREEAVREVCEVLGDVVGREEDGSQWLGYVRLRGVARKR
ncbi:MAG: hypothetical protein Q9160_004533 [Pyrenula sp. 1 TL-2023]